MPDEDRVPPDVHARIAATVEELIETPELARFSIHRGATPARDATHLGADAVVDLFRTEDPAEALEVERALHVRFATHPKARVDPIEAHPRDEPGLSHVYVALWAVADVPPP